MTRYTGDTLLMFQKSPKRLYSSTLLADLPWVIHGFGCRATHGWPPRYTNLKQTHSDKVIVANGRRGCLEQGDALVTSEPGNLIGIRTADCVPILIADPEHRAVAAVHAGWRGTAAGIATKAIEKLTEEFGSRPAALLASIGPAIGPCCFEVGPEVGALFTTIGSAVDLRAANQAQLLEAGVAPERVDVSDLCTVCYGEGEFHSFRRDKESSGRMVSAIGIGL
jgi:purine-nucleoside/S-methyl-5'-thioadenosine phosphorylase / adenosine deaminase